MIYLSEAIAVEGKYDKIKLSSIAQATIISVDGFSIFNDEKKIDLLKRLARKSGLIILTDSDRAGFLIRNYIINRIGKEFVKNAYIPEVRGKEKRKREPGKEGLLGVEGVTKEAIIKALKEAAVAQIDGENRKKIEPKDLYEWGLLGGAGSAEKRKKLLLSLGLPHRLSSKGLLAVFNSLYSYEEVSEILLTVNS